MRTIIHFLSAFALMLMCYSSANATHLMGGDIGITVNVNGGLILEHVNFRDTLGIPAYNQAQFKIEKWDTASNSWSYIGSNVMPQDTAASGGLLIGIPYGIQIYRYRSVPGVIDTLFAQHGAGKYRFITYDCCRNNAILNLSNPGGESFVITCEYTYDPAPAASKYSPEFLAIPIIYGPVNNAWIYNPLPFDSDGDSLSWSLNTPFGKYNASTGPVVCAGYNTPSAAVSGPFTLNSATGQVDWTPDQVGNYVASFEITEYKNGIEIGKVLRDMQYVVIPDTNNNGPIAMPEFSDISSYIVDPGSPNANNSYNYIYYHPNVPLNFTISATDQNNSDILSMTAFGALFNNGSNASFNYFAVGQGNKINGTFSWTPNATDTRDYMIVIRANDGAFSKDFTLILKRATTPLNVNSLNSNLNIVVYPNPVQANGLVNFQLSTNETIKDLAVRIVDISGKVVATREIEQLNAGTNNWTIQEQLQAGFYFAQFTDAATNRSQLVKFVVQ